MKAIVYHRYGSPDVLKCADIERPTPKDNEVLIKVRAASANPIDWHFMRGTPYFMRIMTGLRKPKITTAGVDVAGEVEAIGRKVTRIKPGDEVFGTCRGAFAEYACLSESAFDTKPNNMTFEQAASVPVAALTALQALRDKGHIQTGQKLLINGAAGGVGTFAVQIAKSFGADVTGVCSTRNVEMVRSIGADRVIDYTQEDFTKTGQRYDLILDNISNHSLFACRRLLNPNGILLIVGAKDLRTLLTRALTGFVLSLFTRQKFLMFIAKLNREDLTFVGELMMAGKVIPVIDRRYRLSEVSEAIRLLEGGHARGKIIITVGR